MSHAAPVPVPAKAPLEERRQASNRCAVAVLGGRFDGGVKEALQHDDFVGASRHYVDEALKEMRQQPEAVAAAKAAEAARLEEEVAAAAAERTDALDMERSGDVEYVEEMLSMQLLVAAEAGTALSKTEVQAWSEFFTRMDGETLRRASYRFQCACWAGIVARASEKAPRGNGAVKELAEAIFGEKAAWSIKSIANAVKEGSKECSEGRGRPRSMPQEMEEDVVHFCGQLRRLRVRVTKDTVLDYVMRLLGPHEASLNFARVGDDGEYVKNPELGGFEWDIDKLNHWYYRRFLGDHPQLSTGEACLCEHCKLCDNSRGRSFIVCSTFNYRALSHR